MQKNIIWAVLVIVVLGGVIFWATKPAVQTGNPIKIGAVISQTGFAASYGQPAAQAVQMAVEDINKSGGINGRLVELSLEDDHTDPKQAVSAFQKLTSIDGVQGIVGGLFDFTTKPLFPLADESKVTLISPINLRIPGGFELTPNTFVMLPDFSLVIRQLKTYLAQSNSKKIAVVHFKSTFGQEIASTLSQVSQELARGPIVDEAYYQIGGNDFKTTILKLKAAGVDTVFLDMVDVDPVNFMTRANDLGFKPTIISYHSIVDSFAASDKDKALIEGAVILDWEFSPAGFAAEFKQHWGVEPSHNADKSYSAVYALARAIAATNNTAKVAPYLASHPLETPFGNVIFNQNHAVDSTPVKIEVVKNGVPVEWTQ